MKNLVLTLLFSLFTACLNAQYAVETDPQTRKQGMVDTYDGRVLIPFEYDELTRLGEDSLVLARNGTLFGALDLRGRVLVPLEYELLNFNYGHFKARYYFALAKYPAQRLGGLVDRHGKLVLPMQYEYAQAIFPDLLVARAYRDSVLQFFSRRGEPLFTCAGKSARPGFDQNSVEIQQARNVSFMIRKNGQPFFDSRFPTLRWTDGRRVICGARGQIGMLSLPGDTLLAFIFEAIIPLGDGNFQVYGNDRQQGLADELGRFIFPMGRQQIQKWGPQADDVYVVRQEGKNNADLFDRHGKLLVRDCQPKALNRMMPFAGEPNGTDLRRYLTVGLENNARVGFFHADGRQILPIEFKYILFYHDRHPLLACREVRRPQLKNLYEAWDLAGQRVLFGQFMTLAYTSQPDLLLGRLDSTQLWGFVPIDHPEKAKFEFEQLIPLRSGFFIGKKNGGGWQLFNTDARPVGIGAFDNLTEPSRRYFEQFRQKKWPGQLIALGYRTVAPAPFAINDTGQSFPFDPLPVVEKPAVIEQLDIAELIVESPPVVGAPPVTEVPVIPEEGELVTMAEIAPQFPGGDAALKKFITDNLRYPPLARDNDVQGRVVLSFIVEKDGSLSTLRIIRDIGGGCGKEALRLVSIMPRWLPAQQNSQAVRLKMILPVDFKL